MKLLKKLTNRFKKKTAESLVEVIIAIMVIAMGSGAATSLMVTSIIANTFSKDNLVALNLAVEGIEGIRNIRDTNWVKFAYDKGNCWNMLPDKSTGDDCDAASGNKLENKNYTLDLDPVNYTWGLHEVGLLGSSELDLSSPSTNNNSYRMSFLDITPFDNTDGEGTDIDDQDIYVSDDIITAYGSDTGESKFYRMVSVKIASDDSMFVRSLVQWKTGAAVHQINLSSTLTNYNQVKVGL